MEDKLLFEEDDDDASLSHLLSQPQRAPDLLINQSDTVTVATNKNIDHIDKM